MGAQHHEVVVSPEDFFGALPRLIWHEDEPIAFPSSIALYFVSRLARPHVKVVLTGEGADELFLGYNWYRAHRLERARSAGATGLVAAGAPARASGGPCPRLPRALAPLRRPELPGARSRASRALFYENFAVFPEPLQRVPCSLDRGSVGGDATRTASSSAASTRRRARRSTG